MESSLRLGRLIFAGLVLLIATITFTSLPQPYPHWPTVGAVPVNPELIVPGLFGLIVVVGTLREKATVGSLGTGIFGLLTLLVAVLSLHSLYSSAGGGVFWGGFFTLISGVCLAIGVVVRSILHQDVHQKLTLRVQARFEE